MSGPAGSRGAIERGLRFSLSTSQGVRLEPGGGLRELVHLPLPGGSMRLAGALRELDRAAPVTPRLPQRPGERQLRLGAKAGVAVRGSALEDAERPLQQRQ